MYLKAVQLSPEERNGLPSRDHGLPGHGRTLQSSILQVLPIPIPIFAHRTAMRPYSLAIATILQLVFVSSRKKSRCNGILGMNLDMGSSGTRHSRYVYWLAPSGLRKYIWTTGRIMSIYSLPVQISPHQAA